MKINEIGEFGLIKRLAQKLPALSKQVVKGIGDDTAVLCPPPGKQLLMASDMIAEGVHFSLAYCPLQAIGWKALAVNLSDIAAMGGTIGQATASVAIPAHFEVEELEELYQGLGICAREYGCDIVGGDTIKSPSGLILDITVLGYVEPGGAIYRSGAQVGDVIMVTGSVGDSAAGLYGLSHFLGKSPSFEISETSWQQVTKAHLYPEPRMQEGILLGASGTVTAMNDISDGLASEILEICQASNVGCRLDGDNIHMSPGVLELAEAAGLDPLQWALYGGEDYELVFTVAEVNVAKLKNDLLKINNRPIEIGRITPLETGCTVLINGQTTRLDPEGFNHFGAPIKSEVQR